MISRRRAHRTRRSLPVLVAAICLSLLHVTPSSAAVPSMPSTFFPEIEVPAPYQGQSLCDPHVKKGVGKFRELILDTYPGTGDSGITRGCHIGGRSEHKEGRAWDWRANVNNAKQVRQVESLFEWLFAEDDYGNKDAMARRLGIMYIIWDKRIWHAWDSKWEKYSCSGFTACHRDHVHFSFGWAGARAKTSFWSGEVSPVLDPPKVLIKDSKLPERLTVDANYEYRTKTWFKLREGHRYKITVSDTYSYGYGEHGPMYADGECTSRPTEEWGVVDWLRKSLFADEAGSDHLDLKVLGKTDWEPVKDNGKGCAAGDEHKYSMTIKMKETGPVWFKVIDDNYGDNWGQLQVKVSDV